MKNFTLWLLTALLVTYCGSGPKINVCASDPDQNQFECQMPSSWFSHPKPTTEAFSASEGMIVYPVTSQGDSLLAIYNYCAARQSATTQAPVFTSCTSHYSQGGLTCAPAFCSIIAAGKGVACTSGAQYFVPYSETENYLALSAIDNQGLLTYCNITLTRAIQ